MGRLLQQFGWHLLRWFGLVALACTLGLVGAIWIVYTGDNLVTRAIFVFCAFNLFAWWFPWALGLLFVVELLWRLRSHLLPTRLGGKPPSQSPVAG